MISRKYTGYFNGNFFFMNFPLQIFTVPSDSRLPISFVFQRWQGMQHARQRKTERRFFPLIPDRHLNFISSSITWPLLRLAALSLKKKKNPISQGQHVRHHHERNTPSLFSNSGSHSWQHSPQNHLYVTEPGETRQRCGSIQVAPGSEGNSPTQATQTRSFSLSHRLSYLGTFLRSQFEVIPSFRVNHTSSNFSTPSKKWVLLSTIMLASDWDIIAQGLEGERSICLARWQRLVWENLPWSAEWRACQGSGRDAGYHFSFIICAPLSWCHHYHVGW